MSHEIGKTDHMVSGNKQIPWHKLGTVVDGALTAEQALKLAKLGWRVIKEKVKTDRGIVIPDRFATVREDTGMPLGIVGNRYTCIQNVEGLDILDPVIGKAAVYETAGSLRNGKVVWFLASLKKEYFLTGRGKADQLKQYFLVYLTHDGTKPITVRFVSTRVVCMNTLSAALGESNPEVYIYHTKNYKDKIDEAHRIIGLADTYAQEFQAVYKKLESIKMSENDAKKFTIAWMPGEGTRVENKRTQLFELFKSGIGNEGKTRVDALNAVTQWLSFERPVKSKRGAEARFENNLIGYGVNDQARALELLLS